MKIIYTILCAILFSTSVFSQSPLKFSYQAVIRDSQDQLVTNQIIGIKISILQGSPSGAIVYEETSRISTNANGLISTEIGGVDGLGSVQWANGPYFLKTETDPKGGVNYTISGTSQLLSVPYALYAESTAETGAVKNYGQWNAVTNDPQLSDGKGIKGQYYEVATSDSIASHNTTLNGINDWGVGDWVIYNGKIWEKVDNTEDQVSAQFSDMIESFINKNDDGLTIFEVTGTPSKRFGIGDTQPESPLGILGKPDSKDKMISFTSADNLQKWNINLNPAASDKHGFSIDDASTGTSINRLFIDGKTGHTSVGLIDDRYLLGLKEYDPSGKTELGITNTAVSGTNTGWSLGHLHDNLIHPRNGAFSIMETVDSSIERMIILPAGNVGINEKFPDTKLHVSRPVDDPHRDISLERGSGIIVLGPADHENLVMDSHQIQARKGSTSDQQKFTISSINLQPLGGDILIHSSMAPDQQILLSNDGKIGIGKTPVERLDVNGAITIGNTDGVSEGTIRWTGTDFEGRKKDAWVPFGGAGWTSAQTGKITYNPVDAKVGIGVSTPVSALHVMDNSSVTGSNASVLIQNTSSTSNSGSDLTRIGLEIHTSGQWSSNEAAKNVGLYISNVGGQTNANSNIGAVINGNVVIGGLSSSQVIGDHGTNVLSIQTGTSPAQFSGTNNSGIQIYSGSNSAGTSEFHVMNGDGSIIKLHKNTSLTVPITNVVTTAYGQNEAEIIENLRTRINELENVLKSLGLLQ